MATKKTAPKKAATKKTVKRAPSKPTTKTSVKRVSAKSSSASVQSFKPAPLQEPFFTFRISHQTLYWTILALIVLILGVWVVNINIKVQQIYDQIDATNAASDAMIVPTKKAQ